MSNDINLYMVNAKYVRNLMNAEDTDKQIEFKKTCAAELKWCRDHLSEIERFGKRSICPHYGALEKECNKGKKLPKRSVQKQNKRNQRKSKRHR